MSPLRSSLRSFLAVTLPRTTAASVLGLSLGTVALTAPATLATAQSGTAADAQTADIVRVIRAVDVFCGPGPRYYAHHRLEPGDLVERLADGSDYARIRTDGHAFGDAFAWIKVTDASDADRVTLDTRGTGSIDAYGRRIRTATVNRPLLVLAPKRDGSPADSWRMLVRRTAGSTIEWFGRTESVEGREDEYVRTPMPADAVAYVPADALAPATPRERADFAAFRADPAAWLAARERAAEEAARAREADRLRAQAAARAAETRRLAELEAERDRLAAEAARAETASGDEGSTTGTSAGADADDRGDSDVSAPPAAGTPGAERDRGTDAGPDADADSESDADSGTGTDSDDANAGANDAPSPDDAGPLGTAEPALDASGEPGLVSETLGGMEPEARLEVLEDGFAALVKADRLEAELEPLERLYAAFVADVSAEHPGHARYASRRLEQIRLWAKLQADRRRLDAVRGSLSQTGQEAAEYAAQFEREHDIIGRLTTSRLLQTYGPLRLYRLESLDTRRTVAYVHIKPAPATASGRTTPVTADLSQFVQQVVGIRGERRFDPGLQLDLVEVRSIVPLSLQPRPGGSAGTTGSPAP